MLQMIERILLSETFGYSILRVTTPILFAALAALVSRKAGVTNISLEGTMLCAALAGVLSSASTQNAWLGLAAALLTGVLFAAIMAFCVLRLHADIFLTGIALNSLASGGTVFVMYLVTGDKGSTSALKSAVLPAVQIPVVSDIPVLGNILSGQNVLTYLALAMVVVVFILLYKMPLGLRIRAVGEYPDALRSVGVSVERLQTKALLISGLLCGMGGAFMSMGYASWFARDMVAGRGFIGIAAEAMGRGTPLGTLVASLVFGIADALSNSLQTVQIPSEFVLMIPYLATIIGITLYTVNQTAKANGRKRKKKAVS